jgi:hypothetical protein
MAHHFHVHIAYDATYDAPEWKESEHPRGKGGKFGHGGGGGGGGGGAAPKAPIKSSAWTGRTSAPGRGVKVAVGKATRAFKGLTKEDYEAFKQHLPNAQKTLGQNLAGIARGLSQVLKTHGKEQLEQAKHATGALKTLAMGRRPTPEQSKGLLQFGVSLLMSAGSMALSGDPTGTVGHAAVILGQEFVKGAIHEHAAKLAAGAARYAYHAATGGGDAAAGELSPADVKLLQDFANTLAKVVATMKIPEARLAELLGQSAPKQ